jgi:hypothetical protein
MASQTGPNCYGQTLGIAATAIESCLRSRRWPTSQCTACSVHAPDHGGMGHSPLVPPWVTRSRFESPGHAPEARNERRASARRVRCFQRPLLGRTAVLSRRAPPTRGIQWQTGHRLKERRPGPPPNHTALRVGAARRPLPHRSRTMNNPEEGVGAVRCGWVGCDRSVRRFPFPTTAHECEKHCVALATPPNDRAREGQS